MLSNQWALQNMQTLSRCSDALRPAMPAEKTNLKYLSERNQLILETPEGQSKLHATIKFPVFKISTKTKN